MNRGHRPRQRVRFVLGAAMLMLVAADRREALAQLGALVSPGRLTRAHASLEGVGQCLSCHSAGRKVAPDKCLSCHKPVADRIAQKRGVHRNVTTDCISCHVEHAGVDAELRPFDQVKFNHATETAFPLDGLHTARASECALCHKTRSFLAASKACASCHQDPHRGSLGAGCATCHATSARFASARSSFDHSRTPFPLTGAHVAVRCETCHPNGTLKRAQGTACASCHADPHKREFGPSCTTCHGTSTWNTTRIDHARTPFPLRGRHATVTCTACHRKSSMSAPVPHATCATCHTDPHRGAFKEDCAACHSESSFAKGKFDHSITRFALTDGHAGLSCSVCHRNSAALPPQAARTTARVQPTIDFRGLRLECAACHQDPHAGDLGQSCERCHSSKSFRVDSFTHANQRAFFGGAHMALRCEQCHESAPRPADLAPPRKAARMPVAGLTRTPTACASCHRDVHLGQVGTRCESCHAIDGLKFAVRGFSHEATKFPLQGGHAKLVCASCHRTETAAFAAGQGTAVRLTGIGTTCASCHQDPHARQLGNKCEQCHKAETFKVGAYAHMNGRSLGWFFAGAHVRAACQACHKPEPAPRKGSALEQPVVRYTLPTTCTACHEDKHRGALGPRCETCHRLN